MPQPHSPKPTARGPPGARRDPPAALSRSCGPAAPTPDPLDILVVSLRGPTNAARRGGAQDYVRAVMSRWVPMGHRVRLLCAHERLPDGGTLPDRETVDGIRVERVGTPQSRARPLVQAARAAAPSVDVVVENIMGFPLGLPLLLPAGTPLVAVKHHYQGRTFVTSLGWARGLGGRFLEDVFQPAAYRNVPMVVPSEKTARHVRRHWPSHRGPLVVVPPPVEAHEPVEVERAETPTLVYLGALHLSRKRIDHLLRAFREVLRHVPDARLFIAGDGPDRPALEASAAELPVSFLGFVSDEGKARVMGEAWAFASPSLLEGFGITWVEANAAGLPIVGYRIPGLDTIDESCALLVPPGDVDALADGLVRVLTDRELRRRLSAGARANAQRFDPDAASQAFLRVVEQAVGDAAAVPS